MMAKRLILAAAVALLAACGGGGDAGKGGKSAPGVDPAAKTIAVGFLYDQSGPVAAIGRPYADGLRLAYAEANAEGLPEGWTLKTVERDHGYNPQRSVQMFNEIRDQVLFIGSSFGTPNTMPLRPLLERYDMMAFPASLSRQLQAHPNTPPPGASYYKETLRGIDFLVAQAGDPKNIKLGIVHQQDDYGQDGLDGAQFAAAEHGIEIVATETYAPGQSDYTALVSSLRRAGATHVVLTTVPSATVPILGTAAQLDYTPVWMGNSPSWIDRFFDPSVVPSSVFANYYMVAGLAFWGDDTALFRRFDAARKKFAADATQDNYMLNSYLLGLLQIEAVSRMIAAGDISRAGYRTALQSITDFDALGALPEPVNLSTTPYTLGNQTRVLQPDFANRSWVVRADYAAPTVAH